MFTRTSCILLCLSLLFFVPLTAQAADTPHDATNGVVCTDCHRITSAGGILVVDVPRGAAQAALCNGCHEGMGSQWVKANHVVNGGTTIIDCGSCHNPHGPDVTTDPHTDVEASNLNLIRKKVRNVEGALDLAIFQQKPRDLAFGEADEPWNGICQTCHTGTAHHTNDDSADHDHETGGNCVSCHSHASGFLAGGGACDSCHGAPPATGAHLVHFGGTVDQAAYGGTDNLSSATDYVFQCGTCHPLSSSSHMNDTVDVELYNAGAPAGSLKSLNPPTASYILGSCSNVYCHSETDWSSPVPISQPLVAGGFPIMDSNYNLTYDPYTVTESTVYSTVNWEGPSFDCNGCHRNPPQTSWPEVQASVGNSHAAIDDWGYENLHAFNMGFDPLMCRTCHYNTVTETTTWTRIAGDITLYDDVPIANKSSHVNGIKDVDFDTVNTVTYRKTFSMSGVVYDPADKTCSSVPCHLNQPKPQWGKPYRWGWGSLECDQCHHYGGPWPAQSSQPSSSSMRGLANEPLQIHQGSSGQNCIECHEAHK
jgi:predicted CxxxxCH...CXXCH cytochrome family protein